MPLIKWLLAIPHYLVLLVLGIGALFVVMRGLELEEDRIVEEIYRFLSKGILRAQEAESAASGVDVNKKRARKAAT